MTETFIPATFIRGGSSKGVFFRAQDLPADTVERDRLILTVLGSPDPNGRQLNGMGGGVSSLSKAVVIGPSSRPDADVDYTFAQVAVDRPVVDWSSNCGNLSSAVGPFALDAGFVTAPDGEALVRIHNTNTKKVIHARFAVKDGLAETTGDFAIAGVAGTGARVRLDFLSPGGTITPGLLPTGNVVDTVEVEGVGTLDLSLVDASNPVVYVRASDLGMTGTESPDLIEKTPGLMAKLDLIRRRAGVLMGLGATPDKVGLSSPKVAMVASPAAYETLEGATLPADSHEIAVRMVSMERLHKAVPLTGAMCLGVACRIAGTIPNLLSTPPNGDEIRVGNPSGIVSVGAEVRRDGDTWVAESAVVFRTARILMKGAVAAGAA